MATWKLTVNAGEHRRIGCPVRVNLGKVEEEDIANITLTETATGRCIPCQGGINEAGEVKLHWILDVLESGVSREYLAETVEYSEDEELEEDNANEDEIDDDDEEAGHHCHEEGSCGCCCNECGEDDEDVSADYNPGVELFDDGDKIMVFIGGEPFTSYHYGEQWVKPFLWPAIGPYGDSVTRNYPMIPDVPGEKLDHPHQKSIYTAFGSVNGVDDWSEEPGHGRINHKEFTQLQDGPVLGCIQTDNDWVSKDGVKVMSERRTVIIYNLLPSQDKMIDFTIVFKADNGEVKFGDTKEGGILSVRVATTMDVSSSLGGKIENAFGGINENETWGKPSPWCDYSGPVQGRRVGIAVMDHPNNLRYPTGWHVRNYGLMTANCFAESFYKNDPSKDGSYVIPAGGELVFRYRLLIHCGDAKDGRVAERYHDYINPPQVSAVREL